LLHILSLRSSIKKAAKPHRFDEVLWLFSELLRKMKALLGGVNGSECSAFAKILINFYAESTPARVSPLFNFAEIRV
jgi:hypothetical protein